METINAAYLLMPVAYILHLLFTSNIPATLSRALRESRPIIYGVHKGATSPGESGYKRYVNIPRPEDVYDIGLPSTDGKYRPDVQRWLCETQKDLRPLLTVVYARKHWTPCYMPAASIYCESKDFEYYKDHWLLGKCAWNGWFLYLSTIYTNFTTYPAIGKEQWGKNIDYNGMRSQIIDKNFSKKHQCNKPYIEHASNDPRSVFCVLPKQYLLSEEGYYYYYGDEHQPDISPLCPKV